MPDKGAGDDFVLENGLNYIAEYSNAVMSAKVIDAYDYDTHTLFVAEVTEGKVLSNDKSVTYEYYLENIKTKFYIDEFSVSVYKNQIFDISINAIRRP